MELSFEENRLFSNKVYGGDTRFEGSRAFCSEINCGGEHVDCVIEAAKMVHNMRNEKLTKVDREVIDDCEKKAMERFGYRHEVGDMVWGKVRSHPWWPGQIYNEAFAMPCARKGKREGRVLVAFFGDYSYGWFDPIELIPFDINYVEKSKQTNDRAFVNAVEEAEYEARRRAALGLQCHCRTPRNFRATGVEGFVEVDVCGYQPGGLYSMKQIKSARDGFRPVEMLRLLQELASTPCSNMKRSINWNQNVAAVLAYRKAVFEEVDGTYAQAFGVQPICSTDSSWELDPQEQLASQASSDGLLTLKGSFFCFSNHNNSALSATDHVITEFSVGSISTTPGPGHSSEEVTTLKKKSVPEKISREATRVGNCGASRGFKQFQPRFSKVAKTSHHLKNVKVVGRRTAPPDTVQLHGKVGDNLDEKPAEPKCLGEELHLEEAHTVGKKKRKKELSLEYPHNHLINTRKDSNNGTHSSVSSNFVATEQMLDRRSTSNKVSRYAVYKKPVVLAPAAEAKSPTFDVDAKKIPCNRAARDLASFSKPPKKRPKLLDYANVGPNQIADGGKGVALAAEKNAADGKLVKKQTKYPSQKPDTPARVAKPTMVLMQFPPRSAMPSVSELKARFARFGHLHSIPRVIWKSSTCQVVFKHNSDAEAAYSYAVENKSLFGSVKVEYCLQALEVEVPAPQLSKPHKELAGKPLDVVSQFKPMSTSDPAKAAPQYQLLQHPTVQPKSCLKKQPSNGGSHSHNHVSPTTTTTTTTTATTTTESIDISTQMLSLLTRCSEIVADLKFSLGYVPLNL